MDSNFSRVSRGFSPSSLKVSGPNPPAGWQVGLALCSVYSWHSTNRCWMSEWLSCTLKFQKCRLSPPDSKSRGPKLRFWSKNRCFHLLKGNTLSLPCMKTGFALFSGLCRILNEELNVTQTQGWQLRTAGYGLNVCIPLNSYIETLVLKAVVFRGWVSARWLGHEGGSSWVELVPLKKRPHGAP